MPSRKAGRPAKRDRRAKTRRPKLQGRSAALQRFRELSPHAAGYAIVHDIAKALTSTLQIDQVLKTIMEKVQELLSPDTWSLLLVDEATKELFFQIATGKAADKLKDVRIPMGEGVAGWVAKSGKATIVPEVSKDPRFMNQIDTLTKMRTRSIICVPIRGKERVLGVIEIINYMGHREFDSNDLNLLQAMADYAAIAMENAMHVQRIHELTITDDCTTLYNVRHL
ncbi:MAG: GAF domain-containing protein, partial [Candidatus Acidiferrales bacterium]